MDTREIEQIKSGVGVSLEDPQFFGRAFAYVAKKRAQAEKGEKNPIAHACVEEYLELTQQLSFFPLQDSHGIRHIMRARLLATALIDEKGNLDKEALKRAIDTLAAHTYFLGPDRQEESLRQERMLRTLRQLEGSKRLVLALQNINKPTTHKYAEQIIRSTLHLPANVSITNVHARRAALSALLCTLRQALGSCFATAPAIFIHDEYPELFLTDLNEMLATGQLKRVAGGIEYIVPLSRGWGIGDLKKSFVVSGNRQKDATALSFQPGLLAAFEEGGVISPALSLKEKAMGAKELLLEALPDFKGRQPPYFLTPEQLISAVYLNHYHIQVSDLEEYKKRPNEMIQGSLMMHVPSSGKASGGIGQACVHYLLAFENAKNAFKAIADNSLLRTWEYTIASFAESKADFAKWNFYSSLGLRPEDEGGLGQCLYENVKTKLEQENRKAAEINADYERVYYEAKTMEARFRNASSEQEARWLRIEYQAKASEMDIVQQDRDRAYVMAKRLANLYNQLIDYYINSFPRYYQEVYDPEMIELSSGPYDDSPAGFRLLFKHGRSNTSQWTSIDDAAGFVQSIVSFFMMTEREMDNEQEFKGMQSYISDITTKMITHVRRVEFLTSAFYRMAVAHNKRVIENPLENLEKVEAKPWSYTSGGNVEALLSTYFRKGDKLASASTWVESPTELLVFIADTLKEIPRDKMEVFRENREASLLIHSPTHVFLLKPGRSPLKEAWGSADFTYTWVRDNIIIPAERAVDKHVLNKEMMAFLIDRISKEISPDFHPRFFQLFGNIQGTMSPPFFRSYVMEGILHDPGLQRRGMSILSASTIDALLFSSLPLFPSYQLKQRVQEVLALVPQLTKAQVNQAVALVEPLSAEQNTSPLLTALHLQEICQALVCLATNKTSFPFNIQKSIVDACRAEGYALSAPLLFADTNWVREDFAFVINPGNGKFELWCTDRLGIIGAPMQAWEKWLDGSRKTPTWGIYHRRYEYT